MNAYMTRAHSKTAKTVLFDTTPTVLFVFFPLKPVYGGRRIESTIAVQGCRWNTALIALAHEIDVFSEGVERRRPDFAH